MILNQGFLHMTPPLNTQYFNLFYSQSETDYIPEKSVCQKTIKNWGQSPIYSNLLSAIYLKHSTKLLFWELVDLSY